MQLRSHSVLVLILSTGCSLLGKGDDPYDIELRYVGWTPTAAEEADFDAAAARWESVMTEGLPEHQVQITQAQIDAVPDAEDCEPIDELVDDLVVFVRRKDISGAMAAAAVCVIDTNGHQLPSVARMLVGESILDGSGGELNRLSTIQHELGHALGLTPGAWNIDLDGDGVLDRELLPGHDGTCAAESALTFGGAQATAAYQALGGTGGVPMEPGAPDFISVDGSGCVHLSESVFDDALMSPSADSPTPKLTSVTLGMLADMGYPVDLSAADDYVLPAFRAGEDTGDSGAP
jgi:hypothetical protein